MKSWFCNVTNNFWFRTKDIIDWIKWIREVHRQSFPLNLLMFSYFNQKKIENFTIKLRWFWTKTFSILNVVHWRLLVKKNQSRTFNAVELYWLRYILFCLTNRKQKWNDDDNVYFSRKKKNIFDQYICSPIFDNNIHSATALSLAMTR